jgi:hypothetical protein
MTSNGSTAFTAPALRSSSGFYGSVATLSGDLTDNGQSDLVAVNADSVWVMLSSGTGLGAPQEWSAVNFYGTEATLLADLTGNGRDDLVAVDANSVWVMLSTGIGFAAPVQWSSGAFYGSVTTLAGDVNGDGWSDLIAVNSGSTWVMTSNGSDGFSAPVQWSSGAFYGSVTTLAGDVNGDGRADLIAVNSDSTWVMTSNGSDGFTAPTQWSSGAFYGGVATLVGDFNGDGRADLIAVNSDSTWVMTSTGSAFAAPTEWSSGAFYGSRATLVYATPEALTPITITTTSLPAATKEVSYSTVLSASGGTSPLSWTVRSGSLPAGLNLSSDGVISGLLATSGTSDFSVQVTDSSTPTPQTKTASLSITVDATTPSAVTSPNWSGYVLDDGPYSSVTGTFTVPDLAASAGQTYASEWVGIDGFSNHDLIQSGVGEMYDPTTNLVYTQAWWEILPAAETPITMTVLPGDSVTVTVSQIAGTSWAISLTNLSTGQSFTTDQSYSGPASSADWIVEAPEVDGQIATLGSYSPDVTFSSPGETGASAALVEAAMVQSGVQVSSPSAWTAAGFAVAFGDLPPPPP